MTDRFSRASINFEKENDVTKWATHDSVNVKLNEESSFQNSVSIEWRCESSGEFALRA